MVLAGLWLGLRVAFDGLERPSSCGWSVRAGRFLGAFGAPWAFLKLGLAEREADFEPKPITW